jgi:cobalamin biosynthesis protein CbiD
MDSTLVWIAGLVGILVGLAAGHFLHQVRAKGLKEKIMMLENEKARLNLELNREIERRVEYSSQIAELRTRLEMEQSMHVEKMAILNKAKESYRMDSRLFRRGSQRQ